MAALAVGVHERRSDADCRCATGRVPEHREPRGTGTRVNSGDMLRTSMCMHACLPSSEPSGHPPEGATRAEKSRSISRRANRTPYSSVTRERRK